MARPKANEKRDRQVNIALTEREFDELRQRAAEAGLRVAEFARMAMLARTVATAAISSSTRCDPLTVEAVRRLGVALTQIARQLEDRGVVSPPDLRPLLADIRATVARAMTPTGALPSAGGPVPVSGATAP